MKYVGAHVSTAGGIYNAPVNAYNIGAKSFALFVKNQLRWEEPPLSEKDIKNFKENLLKYGYSYNRVLPHAGYLINLGSPDEDKRNLSLKSFIQEAKRCEELGLIYLNFHPGSHLNKISEERCMDNVIESLNSAMRETEFVTFVIENTAGQGSNIGYSFEQIRYIIDGVLDKERVKVCFDTCHAFSAGYDIASRDNYDAIMRRFDSIIGLNYLVALHINDSKKGLGSRIDRHENLGKGLMGTDVFRFIMNDKNLEEKLLIIETPDDRLWKDEIDYLYSLVAGF